jgi:hypothetical protein
MPRYDNIRMGTTHRPWQGANPDAAQESHESGGVAQKVDQTVAGYLPPEEGPFQCAGCVHFSQPDACEIVDGVIAPDGCCNLYTKGNG